MIVVSFHDLPYMAVWADPCKVLDITGGGGDLFDCLNDGAFDPSVVTGTGFTNYYSGDSPFGNIFGDTFVDYATGTYSGGTPGASVTGFTTIYVG